MELFETLLFLIILLELYILIFNKRLGKNIVISLCSVNIISILLHMLMENSRWQLIFLYISLGFGIALILLLHCIVIKKHTKLIRVSTIVLIFIFISISGISKYVFPMSTVPAPTGEYLIGTESFIWTDENREEAYGNELHRRIKVQFWYPTDSIEGYEIMPWIEDGKIVTQQIAKSNGLPAFTLNHTSLIMSNSYKSAPLSDISESYPVIIISHGWGGFKNLHTDLAEEMASLGYIVISIDHTYGSVATVFGEDDVSNWNPEALPPRDETDDFHIYSNTLVSTYADDISFSLDELERMNDGDIESRFEGRLDLNNIGHFGHSTGGGAGAQVAIRDDRIKALFGMDSWVEPVSDYQIDIGLDIPCLFVRSEEWLTGENNVKLNQLVDDNIMNTRLYNIYKTKHYDFSMSYMYSPLSDDLGITGELEGEYLVSIYRSMMKDFFDQTLKVDGNVELIIIQDEWTELVMVK